MVDRTFDNASFTLKLGLKDVELALAAGGDTQVPLPMAGVIREQHIGALDPGFDETGCRDYARNVMGPRGAGAGERKPKGQAPERAQRGGA